MPHARLMLTEDKLIWMPTPDDCCKTQAGKANPSLSVDFQVRDGGLGLLVKVDTDHPCGIDHIIVRLRLIADPAKQYTLNARMTKSFEWKFGPNEARRLPDPIGPSVSIFVFSISECATGARFEKVIQRF